MDPKRIPQNCKRAEPTLLLPPPLWLEAWSCLWTCRMDDGRLVPLESTEICATCARWEPRETAWSHGAV